MTTLYSFIYENQYALYHPSVRYEEVIASHLKIYFEQHLTYWIYRYIQRLFLINKLFNI